MTPENLKRLYVDERRSTTEIAAMFGYRSSQTIANAFHRFGIPIRSRRDAQRPVEMPGCELRRLYEVEQLSVRAIAARCGYSEETIRRLMVSNGIRRRSKTEGFGGHNKGQPMSHEQRARLSETRRSAFSAGAITHWNKGRTTPESVRRRISKGLLDGRDPAPSYYGHDWNMQRTARLQLDDYTCQQCGERGELHVHHWEPYRFSFDNSIDNLVTLCASCHRDMHAVYRSEGFTREAEEVLHA